MEQFKTLEQLISEAWARKGLEVVEEKFKKVKGKKDMWRWIITARLIPAGSEVALHTIPRENSKAREGEKQNNKEIQKV